MSGVGSRVGAALAVSAAFFATSASAQDFYKDRTVSIIVGFTPGGGYDAYARQLARFLPDHIPGKPNVIIQNMPGAGSLTAVRAVDATQPKDGTVMVIFNPGLILQSVVQPEKAPVDFRRYTFVGTVTPDFRVCYGYGPNGVKSFEELMSRKEFVVGSTAKGSGNYVNAAILRDVLGAPIKHVLGFPGSAEQRLAVERGELDGDCGSWASIPPSWIRDRKIHAFVRFTRDRQPDMPDSARFVNDFAKTKEQVDLLDALNSEDEVGRPFIMSKDVPADRLAVIRKAFDETTKDPVFLSEMERQQLPVAPITGARSDEILAKIMSVSPAIAQRAKIIFD